MAITEDANYVTCLCLAVASVTYTRETIKCEVLDFLNTAKVSIQEILAVS
jgi:hypothetical protein